ncbi:hypothetical protein ACFYZ3_19385 [Streptomyces sp. NPDC001599]|uniref:hypothetical protein n=1 Tax=Streptomyces sp. NPDC001599 TaxID=3364591 RepID=UPI0036BBA725
MSVRPSTDDWRLIAFGATVVCTAALYRCMPTARKVGADIREQEEKPWDKVPLNTFSLYWMIGSGTACTGAAAYFWEYLALG